MRSILFLAVCLLVGCAHHRLMVVNASTPKGVSVSGVGRASAPPDLARTNLGVEVRAANAEQASADANTRMAAVIEALEKAGVAAKDLRTHSYSIQFEPEPQPDQAQSRAPGPVVVRGVYRVTNVVEATLRDLTLIGRVLSAATNAGANNVWGVAFELENDGVLVSRARALAVADAKHAADELASLTGVKLGPIVSIIETEPAPAYQGGSVLSMRAAQADVPIETGELAVTYTVQVIYEAKD
jgi:uncharacterized protein YggE